MHLSMADNNTKHTEEKKMLIDYLNLIHFHHLLIDYLLPFLKKQFKIQFLNSLKDTECKHF